MLTKRQIKNNTIKSMKELGTYQEQYEDMINIYSGLLHQYTAFEKEFEKSGYQVEEEYTNKGGATNMRKTPLYTAMESLRKDIATYSDKLCLNPKSIESVNIEIKTPSKLEMALSKLE